MVVSGQLHAPAAVPSEKDPIPIQYESVRAFWRSGCFGGEDTSTNCRWKCLNDSSVRHREFFPKRLISSSFFFFVFIFFSFFLSFLSPLLILEEMWSLHSFFDLILFSTRSEIPIIPYFAVLPFGHSALLLTCTVHRVSRLYTGAHTSRERAVSLKMISQALIVSETCGNLVSVQLFSIVSGTICASTFLIGFVGHAAWQFLHRVTSGERENTLKSHFCRQPIDPVSYLSCRTGCLTAQVANPTRQFHIVYKKVSVKIGR